MLKSGILALATIGCGAAQHAEEPHGFHAGWYAVTFTHAVIAPRRPDNTPWHVTEPDHTSVLIGGLAGLAIGDPGLGTTIGKALVKPGGEPLAPAPYVTVRIAGNAYRNVPTVRSYSTSWDQPFAIDARRLAGTEPVLIQVMDAVDDSMIGQYETTLADLLAGPGRTLAALGPIASLDYHVAPMRKRERSEFHLVVPSTQTLASLVRDPVPGWLPVPVWNGDTVTIQASGEVCPSSVSDDCFGPAGAEGDRWRSYNYDELREAPHASLVAILPGSVYDIGASRRLRAETSGMLLLFVNDTDVSNNRGAYDVHVVIDPPP